MQVDSKTTLRKTIQATYKIEGLTGFFRGVGAPIAGVTPYTTM